MDTKYGQMAVFMKDIGKMIRLMGEVDLFMLTEISMMDSGKMIKLMDSVNIHIQMEHSMKDIG